MLNPDQSNRRRFLQTTTKAAAAATATSWLHPLVWAGSASETSRPESAESIVGQLYQSLSDSQRKEICFDWDYQHPKRGLLRTFVANNWNVTRPEIISDFYTDDQRDLIRQVFEGIIHPDWHDRYDQQLEDDAGGFGHEQSVAIFGKPGEGKFEMVITGRHMTLRCDGDSADHVAFGGPIFYGHAPEFNEGPNHTDNVFWHQALAANRVYQMLSGRQQKEALVAKTPREQAIAFRGSDGDFLGLPVSDMSSDQREHLQQVLRTLTEMYRQSDQDEVTRCLREQGGLDACSLAFFSDRDIGKDEVWDNWRLEGPSFVWHYRGAPHVHVWVNVADSAEVKTNS
jgi:hypothetical protein